MGCKDIQKTSRLATTNVLHLLKFKVLLLKLVSVLHASAYRASYITFVELHLSILRILSQQIINPEIKAFKHYFVLFFVALVFYCTFS